jgi:CTP:molybdopterin cytidylyltransferase MocA
MTAHVKDATANHEGQSHGGQSDAGKDDTTLAELRKSVTEIANNLALVAERRREAVKEAAQAGASELRHSIRRQPVLTMSIAAAAGALLAITTVPRWSSGRGASRWDGWVPHVTRADLHDVADNLQRSVARAMNGDNAAPVTSSFERLVEALTKIESKDNLNEVLQKAQSWFQRMRSPTS